MTSILILQQPSSSSPVDRWFLEEDPEARLTVITGPNPLRRGEYAPGVKVVQTEDYFSPETVTVAYNEAQRLGADYIVSNAEQDVLRAAELRDALGLPGTSGRLALKFRDKLLMKQLFKDAGLAFAEAAQVRCVEDIVMLSRQHGQGVVKPIDGMGTKDLVLLPSRSTRVDVFTALARHLDDLHSGRLMWEEFIPGDGLHCDVTLNGPDIRTFSVSRTLAPPHAYRNFNYTSYTLDQTDPTYAKARASVERLVASLPMGHGVTVLHFEMFENPDGTGLTAGEIGARMGGGGIRAAVREVTGRDIAREGYLFSAGYGAAIRPTPPPQSSAGWMLFTSTVPDLGDTRPSWLVSTWTRSRQTEAPRHSVDSLGGMIVRASSSESLRTILQSLHWHT